MPIYLMDTGDGRRLEIEADNPAAAEALTNSWASENPYTRSESSSMAGMLPAGAEIAPTEVRSLPEQAAIIPQGIAGFGSGVAQTATGIGELVPGQLGEASARATQYLQSVGAPEMQTAGRIAGSIAPGAAVMRGVQALGAGARAVIPALSTSPVLRGAGTIAGGTLGGGAAGVATGLSTPTGIEDREQRFGQKINAATDEAGWGAGLGFALSALPQAGLAIQAIRPSQNRFIAERTQGVTPQQFSAAEALSQEAERLGVRITAPEALQAVTQGGTSLGSLQRRLETSPGGEQMFSQFMAERPQQVQRAVSGFLGDIAPSLPSPSVIGPRLLKVGEDVNARTARMRTAATQPFYSAAREETVNPNAVRAVVKDIRALAAEDKSGKIIAPVLNQLEDLLIAKRAQAATKPGPRVTPPGMKAIRVSEPPRPATPEEYITDVNTLEMARQLLRERAAVPLSSAEGISSIESGRLLKGLKSLADRLEKNVPELAKGRREFGSASRRDEDFKSTATGQFAAAKNLDEQREALFPTGERLMPGQEGEIGRAFSSIRATEGRFTPEQARLPDRASPPPQAPPLAGQLIRQELERISNRTAGQLTAAGLPDQYAGAAFASALQRNPQYQRNLTAAMQASGVPTQPMQGLMDVLQATGYRQRPGSATASNLAEQEAMSALGLGGVRQAVAAPLRTVSQAFARQSQEEVTRNLSQIALSGPEGIRTLQRMAQNAGLEGETARAILRSRNIAVPGILGAVGE